MEDTGESTPARVPDQDGFFLVSSLALLGLDRFQLRNRSKIRRDFFSGTTNANAVPISYSEVAGECVDGLSVAGSNESWG